MLSPYALTRPGGVQGQVLGLSRALRRLGHEVTVLGPADPGESGADPDVFVIGPARGVRANGSVAPVTVSPVAAWRAVRFVRLGAFDVLHLHEPLAPIAGYGFMLRPRVPMVGTYHRAGVSRWVPVLRPLVELVGRRMQVRVAVSEAARETAMQSSPGTYELLFNGVDMDAFATVDPVPSDHPTVLFLGRHETRKGLGVLLDAFAQLHRPAVLWVASDGPQTEVQQRRYPESDRVKWLGRLRDDERDARLLGADVLCAPSLGGESFGMVLLEGMAARCAVVASDLPGYRAAAAGHAVLVPPGDRGALSRALGTALADAVEGNGRSSNRALKSAEAHVREWSMDRLAVRYVEIYERAIRAGARPARP